MPDLPSGTVTFLFTDIEGSTRLLHELGAAAYADALAEHRRVARAAFLRHGGVEVDTQGDAFFIAFAAAPEAVRAARELTEELASGPLRVRMGVHTGKPLVTKEGYVGADVHRAARIAAAGHGGQVVISPVTAELVGEGPELVPLGTHRLKDFEQPVVLFQLGVGEFPPLKTIANTNLPTPASSFLGRENELAEADRLLRATRLLTVLGPGGAGKTRFALELGRRAREERFSDYRDGVFWVGLAALRDPALVIDTIGQAVGAKEAAGSFIGAKHMLLLVDNFEHVVSSAGDLSVLLEVCPNLTVIVTSRELLGVTGELAYALPPLPEDEGVLLFCARSERESSEDVRELCRRLDGLPLAIELAAARARMLSPAELLSRLSERLDLLKGRRDADPRHQTLRAMIEWSHDLLSDEERQLFRRLAVFAGSWSLEGATQVADADLDALQSLFDKSLVRRTEDGRFFMLETIREFARERLEEAGELETMGEAHVEYMLRCARESLNDEVRWDGARKLKPERENVRTAMRWALDGKQSETSLLLATAYALLCTYRGPFSEGRTWLAEAIEASPPEATLERANAVLAAAALAGRQRDVEQARHLAEAGLQLARKIDHSQSIARALVALGLSYGYGTDYEKAEGPLLEALALAEREGLESYVREALAMLGWIALARRDYAQARAVIGRGLELSRRAGDARGVFYGTGNLGHVAAREGKLDEALGLFREAVLIGQQQDLQSEAEQFVELAAVAAAVGHYERALIMLGAADAFRQGTESAPDPVSRASQEATLSTLRRNLDEDEYRAAWQRGRAMTLEQAVSYAVQFIDEVRPLSF